MENRKKVLITGGTQGIGAAAVRMMAAQGYEVHLTYRKSSKKAEELEAEYPGQVFGWKLDQGNVDEIRGADFLTEHQWYGVIFNASLGSGTVKEYAAQGDSMAAANDQAMLAVNALGPLLIYKKLQAMLEKKETKTKLIFVSSVGGGLAAFPKFTLSDGMSKAAVAFLAKQLSAENARTLVDVFCICPGATETPMFTASTLSKMGPDERRAFDEAQAKKRLIQPEEIAYWMCQLLKDESTVLHGACIDATMGLASRPGIQTEAGLEHN